MSSAGESSIGAVAAVGLGSNVGDREANLAAAVYHLASISLSSVRVSSRYETEPVGGPPQGDFLNAAAVFRTRLNVDDLFVGIMRIEEELGRVRAERFGPRTIDIDLLLFGDVILDREDLVLPHPRMCDRRFVLEPLAEIAPDLRHPVRGRSVGSLLDDLTATDAGAFRVERCAR